MARAQTIAELAEAIADGTPVDWASAESSARTEWERAAIQRLKRIGQLSERRRHPPAAAPSAPDPGLTVSAAPLRAWGHLTLLEQVGAGAFGDVYRAHDPKLARDVALKLLREPALANTHATAVIEEGRLLARVRHPNVVTAYGADNIGGRAGIWMEFLHGRTLEHVLREHGRFGAREAALIGIDLARALAAVHGAGLVHRDVKAQNVMREDGGRVVLMDFGTGRERELADNAVDTLTGTPLYLAPEVLQGDAATVRSDVYSLGVLLYHLVTDSYPIAGRTLPDVLAAHRDNSRTRLRDARPELPPAFVQVVERATAADPKDRYATAGDLEAALAGALADTSELVVPRPAAQTTAPSVPKGWLRPVVAVGLLVVAAAAGLMWRLGSSPQLHVPPGGRAFVLFAGFDNKTDQPNLETAIHLSLQAELVNSKTMSMVDSTWVGRVLTLMRMDPNTRLDSTLAQHICVRDGGIDAFVAGFATQVGPSYKLQAQVFNGADGRPVTTASAEASSKSDLMAAIGRLADDLRTKLGESASDLEKGHRTQEKQVTTRSYEAWVLYSQAYSPRVYDWKVTLGLIEKAVSIDPSFAMAHTWHAWALWNLGRPQSEQLEASNKAMALRGGLQDWEQLWIEASDASFRKEMPRSVEKLKALLAIDPTHDWAAKTLLDYLTMAGHPTDALPQMRQAAALRPYDFDAVSRVFQAAKAAGNVQVARESAERLRTVATTFGWDYMAADAWTVDAWTAWRRGDMPGTLQSLDKTVASLKSTNWDARTHIVTELLYFYLALGRTHDLEKVAALSANPQSQAFVRAMAAYWRDDPALPTQLPLLLELEPTSPLNPTLADWPQDPQYWLLMLLRAGRLDTAELLVASRERRRKEINPYNDFPFVLRAQLLLKQGNDSEASKLLSNTRSGRQGSPLYAYNRAATVAAMKIGQHDLEGAANALRKAQWMGADGAPFPTLAAPLAMENLATLIALDRLLGNTPEADELESRLRGLLSVADSDFTVVHQLSHPTRSRMP